MSYLHAPVYLLRALSANLARLRARESLRTANAVALGSGTMKPADARKLLRELRDDANSGPRRRSAPPAYTLADFGIVAGDGKRARVKVGP